MQHTISKCLIFGIVGFLFFQCKESTSTPTPTSDVIVEASSTQKSIASNVDEVILNEDIALTEDADAEANAMEEVSQAKTTKEIKSKPSPTTKPIKETVSKTTTEAKQAGVEKVEAGKQVAEQVVANNTKVVASTAVKHVPAAEKSNTVVEEVASATQQVVADTKEAVEQSSKPSQRLAQSRPMHKFFDYLLSTYVDSQGRVNYKGIQSEIVRLDNYLGELQRFPPKADWPRADRLAYWINAYNAYTIKLILNNYPVKSITDIAGGKPWDKEWIELDGKMLSLNAIENKIIRPEFKEPRIHFAVNCAAASCPPIANKAFTPDNLEALLESSTVAFINNSKYNEFGASKGKVSKIFEWYGEDFGDVKVFIHRYLKMKMPPLTSIEYKDYDWSLNSQ